MIFTNDLLSYRVFLNRLLMTVNIIQIELLGTFLYCVPVRQDRKVKRKELIFDQRTRGHKRVDKTKFVQRKILKKTPDKKEQTHNNTTQNICLSIVVSASN